VSKTNFLEEVRLFHDAQELLFIDLAITIPVSLVGIIIIIG